jgi:hypothetical protein
MDNPVIPQEVARFILDHIDSIAQLEALLLLRSSPDTWWECKQVAERLYISEENCSPILERQCERGLLLSEKVGGKSAYRYRPKTGDLREMVDRLAYYYSKHLVPVSNLVHAKARSRIEGFAQAFNLKSEK